MDTRTGEILSPEQMAELRKEPTFADQVRFFEEMKVPPTRRQLKRKPPKVGRNEPCPCGSGKKFKRCHWTGRE